jgi:hypothetical protein
MSTDFVDQPDPMAIALRYLTLIRDAGLSADDAAAHAGVALAAMRDACALEGLASNEVQTLRDDLERLADNLRQAKNLLLYLHGQHPMARKVIEDYTSNWFIWGEKT